MGNLYHEFCQAMEEVQSALKQIEAKLAVFAPPDLTVSCNSLSLQGDCADVCDRVLYSKRPEIDSELPLRRRSIGRTLESSRTGLPS